MELTTPTVIIDPTSPEPNRGSFCYLPYLLSNAIPSTLFEDFTLPQLDVFTEDFYKEFYNGEKEVLIALWSYPQKEFCLYLHRHFKGKAKFFGYYPLIEELGLPVFRYTRDMILRGMETYPMFYKRYKHLLLSDCDEHIKSEDGSKVTMYPLFTSYGCPRGCKFCSATVNNQKDRYVLPLDTVKKMLEECHNQNVHCIHFTDEDFFFHTERAYAILKYAMKLSNDWQFIALAHLTKLKDFIDYMNKKASKSEWLNIWRMLKLVEVGLETAAPTLAREMGKRNEKMADMPSVVHSMCPVPILWLTMTFFPGETITTLNETGAFLKEHGIPYEKMSPRLVTNGTWGGLGQFFQFYHGCGMKQIDLLRNGTLLSDSPVRLLPSYIPDSFLDSEFVVDKKVANDPEVRKVYEFYKDVYALNVDESYMKRAEALNGLSMRVLTMCEGTNSLTQYMDICIDLAVKARLGIIKGVE